jgi:hypothetical protein
MKLERLFTIVAARFVSSFPWYHGLVNVNAMAKPKVRLIVGIGKADQLLDLPKAVLAVSALKLVVGQAPMVTKIYTSQHAFKAFKRHLTTHPLLAKDAAPRPSTFAILDFDNTEIGAKGKPQEHFFSIDGFPGTLNTHKLFASRMLRRCCIRGGDKFVNHVI